MKLNKYLLLGLLFVFNTIIISQTKIPLSLSEIFSSNELSTTPVKNIQWQPNGKAFSFTENESENGILDIYQHIVATGKTILLIKGDELAFNKKRIVMSSYKWTSNGNYLLIEGPVKSIWRHSTQAPFYLLNVKTKKITALANNDKHLRNVKLSPDGKYVGFVREHNIYIVNLSSGEEKAITTNGTSNVLNGEFDWVYEEEFGLSDAWRWSPDSKKIAFWQLNQTRVKEFHLVDEMYSYNKVFNLKYPKVGERNAIVKVAVANVESGKTK